MSSIQIVPGLINPVEPPKIPVLQVKTEAQTVIKSEPPELVEIGVDSLESEEKMIPDIKDIDIVWQPLCEGSIKSETKHSESVETPFVKIELKSEYEELIKTEDTSNGNGQEVVEVQGSNEHFSALDILETSGTNSGKAETTSGKKEKEKMEVIRVPIIPVEPHEYTSLTEDNHVCNHCQQACNKLKNLKLHIKRMHRKVTTMYKCPYCSYMSKRSVRDHIIQKHKDAKDIRWFQCHLCDLKFKLNYQLTRHIKVHLKHDEMQDRLDLHEKRYWCDKCDYKTDQHYALKRHELTHLEPKESQYFHCYHCPFKSRRKEELKQHIFKHFRNEDVPFHCYICDFMTPKRDLIFEHFKKHSQHRSKWDETEYKYQLETLKKREKGYQCDKCDFKTVRRRYLKNHKLVHLKPEEAQYFHCYHCSYKSYRKETLKTHISIHFKNEDIPFYCYICDFMTPKRGSIIEHLKRHSKHRSKCDETTYKYLLETCIRNFKTRYSCDKCEYKTYQPAILKAHSIIHLKPEEIQYLYCCHCPYKCPRKNQLRRHVLKKHGEIKLQ